jgi:ABC-type nitrate/sulfonate/bicarbonate transport system permease component
VAGRLARWGPTLAFALVLLGVWEAAVRVVGANPILLPGPVRVLEALWTFRADAVRHLVPTLIETVVGGAVSIVFGVLVAAVLDRVAWLRRAVEPLLIASQTVPIVALAPLLVLWFGFGLAPKVLVVVLVTFFPITVALLDGFRSAPPESTDLLRSYAATDGQAFRLLRWPAALPALFTGLRVSAVYAVIGAVFGEYVGASEGLGIWMQLSQNAFRTDLVFAAVLLSAIVSIALYVLVTLLERAAIPWSPRVRSQGVVVRA